MHSWEQIQKTIDYIESHLNVDINIKSLAEIASLSPFYYQRLFSRLVKKPVAEYIKLRRMAKSTELLLDKGKRILDVALELGFSSHEHFTRSFKDTFGITPDDYRNKPQVLNRMTKPELLLNYTIIDEGVPLITDGIVLEISRQQITERIRFVGLNKKMPVQFVADAGTESGVDHLAVLWNTLHNEKEPLLGINQNTEEIGVAYPCEEDGFFNYFAGTAFHRQSIDSNNRLPNTYTSWELPQGEYIVCLFEAESFDMLVLDAIYKAQNYLFSIWLPNHSIETEPFCAERYESHVQTTTSMEIWVKVKDYSI